MVGPRSESFAGGMMIDPDEQRIDDLVRGDPSMPREFPADIDPAALLPQNISPETRLAVMDAINDDIEADLEGLIEMEMARAYREANGGVNPSKEAFQKYAGGGRADHGFAWEWNGHRILELYVDEDGFCFNRMGEALPRYVFTAT